MSNAILESVIKKITIRSPWSDTIQSYDVDEIFEELNIFENMLVPVMTGNIVIKDAVGLSAHMRFDGSEYIDIEIDKDIDSPTEFNFKQSFVIYSQSDRTNINQNTEMYVLHFASEEYVISAQSGVAQIYTGTHSDIIKSILKDKLYFDVSNFITEGAKTQGIHDFIPGARYSPFDAIEFLTKRSLSAKKLPEFFFWRTKYGYHFNALSNLLEMPSLATITGGIKNVGMQQIDSKYAELFAARDIRIISGFNYIDGIQEGMYAGTFVGFDTLTRTIINLNVSNRDVMDNAFGGDVDTIPVNIPNPRGQDSSKQYDSKLTLYPTQLRRSTDAYLRSTNPESTIKLDDTEYYMLQRPMILNTLFSKTVEVVLPGSFFLQTGDAVELNIPIRDNSSTEVELDKSMSGKYLITMARHIIKSGGQTHETILHLNTTRTNAPRS